MAAHSFYSIFFVQIIQIRKINILQFSAIANIVIDQFSQKSMDFVGQSSSIYILVFFDRQFSQLTEQIFLFLNKNIQNYQNQSKDNKQERKMDSFVTIRLKSHPALFRSINKIMIPIMDQLDPDKGIAFVLILNKRFVDIIIQQNSMSTDSTPQYIIDNFKQSKKAFDQLNAQITTGLYIIAIYASQGIVAASNQFNGTLELQYYGNLNHQKWTIQTSLQGNSFIIRSITNGKLVTRTSLGRQLILADEKPGQKYQKWVLSYDQNGQMILDQSQNEFWLVQSTSPGYAILGYPLPAPGGSFFKWRLTKV